MASLEGRLFLRRSSCSDFRWQRVQGFCIYLLTVLANVVHTESNNVTASEEVDYSTTFFPNSTIEILIPSTSIPTTLSSLPPSSALVGSSFDRAQSTNLYPSLSPLDISEMVTSDFSAYTTIYNASEMTSALLSIFGTPSMISSPTSPMLSTPMLSQSLTVFQASQIVAATPSVISTVEMVMTSSELGDPSSQTMLEHLSPLMSSTESPSPLPSSYEASLSVSTQAVIMTSPVSMTTASQAPSSSSPSSSSSSSLYSSPSPVSYMPTQSSISLISGSSSGITFTITQSLSPSPIIPTPSPTVDTSSQPNVTTAGPDQLSILEWFGIAVGGAAVLFILFLLFHCYQLRQRTIRRQKKEMKKEILDFSQSNRNDRISSWRNSLALDAMATHIELPQEDSMDMQSMDNLGFEEVFLGDEPKSSANNNYFLPQTNL